MAGKIRRLAPSSLMERALSRSKSLLDQSSALRRDARRLNKRVGKRVAGINAFEQLKSIRLPRRGLKEFKKLK